MTDTTPQQVDQIRQQLAVAYAELKRGAAAQAYIDAHAHEVRLICDALEIDVPTTADPIIEAIATLRRERDEARLAHDTAKWMIDGQHEEIEYLRNRKDKPGCAQAHEDIATVEAELATLRRDLAEARAEREAITDGLYRRGYGHVDADWLLAKVDEAKRLRHRVLEAVAETARVRAVYRDALAILRGEVQRVVHDLIERGRWDSGEAGVASVATYTQEPMRIAGRLQRALDGAATTGPETASASPDGV